MPTTAQIADALTASLNGGSFSQSFTAVRTWLVKYDLTELATLRVAVAPRGETWELLDRGRDKQTHTIDVGILKQVDPAVNTQVDPLAALLGEIAEHCRQLTVTAGGVRAVCMGRATALPDDSLIAKELLEEKRAFLGVLRTTWVPLQ